MADLLTVPNVEIARAGTWEISTGEWVVTPADLAAAVEAFRAGVLRKPVLKLGHSGMGDAAPCLGRLDNLRTAEGGRSLVCDLTGVPRAIAAMMPNAWPDRSVEALQNYTDANGKTWRLLITGLALLGATAPGVDSLADVAELFGVAAWASRRIMAAHSVFRPENHDIRRQRAVDVAVAVAAARRRRTHR